LGVVIPLAVLIGWVWLVQPLITRKRRNDDYLP